MTIKKAWLLLVWNKREYSISHLLFELSQVMRIFLCQFWSDGLNRSINGFEIVGIYFFFRFSSYNCTLNLLMSPRIFIDCASILQVPLVFAIVKTPKIKIKKKYKIWHFHEIVKTRLFDCPGRKSNKRTKKPVEMTRTHSQLCICRRESERESRCVTQFKRFGVEIVRKKDEPPTWEEKNNRKGRWNGEIYRMAFLGLPLPCVGKKKDDTTSPLHSPCDE